MGSGFLADAELEAMVEEVKDIPGDFAEIGVFRGTTLRRLASHAARLGRMAHGFDSFVGMNTPGPFDGENYAKGKFNVQGVDGFVRQYFSDVPLQNYQLWPGYVPDCFAPFPAEIRFALVYVDLDHYEPTLLAMQWAWDRLNRGGILMLDDFFVDKPELLASKAIYEFLNKLKQTPGAADMRVNDNDQVMIKKKM